MDDEGSRAEDERHDEPQPGADERRAVARDAHRQHECGDRCPDQVRPERADAVGRREVSLGGHCVPEGLAAYGLEAGTHVDRKTHQQERHAFQSPVLALVLHQVEPAEPEEEAEARGHGKTPRCQPLVHGLALDVAAQVGTGEHEAEHERDRHRRVEELEHGERQTLCGPHATEHLR